MNIVYEERKEEQVEVGDLEPGDLFVDYDGDLCLLISLQSGLRGVVVLDRESVRISGPFQYYYNEERLVTPVEGTLTVQTRS